MGRVKTIVKTRFVDDEGFEYTFKPTVQDVINAEYTLEPLKCLHCGHVGEVTFLQYLGDGQCGMCGRWQIQDVE